VSRGASAGQGGDLPPDVPRRHKLVETDHHFEKGCLYCHKGNEKADDKDAAHQGMVKRPSSDLAVCGECHEEVAANYKKSLHYTTIGQRNRVIKRMSVEEAKIFDDTVFRKSCNACHASCGDCHVKSPAIAGVSLGLINKHKFVRKDEGKTCAYCHGGRVYPEYTGEYGGNADVHYQKGMLCMDCHTMDELHGDGRDYALKEEVRDRPRCTDCHERGREAKLTARVAHLKHSQTASCFSCHSAGEYRQCYNCHNGHSEAKPGFFLGTSPRNHRTITTLRIIPTVRDTFKPAGIQQANFDALPNYWDAPIHNIRKRTERTRNCDNCHEDRKGFLTMETLLKDSSRVNLELINKPKPIPINK